MAHKEPDEKELIARCQRGESQALGALYERYKDQVYAISLRLCQHANDAEDVLQEVFVKIHKSIKTFRGDASFSTWVHRITINTTRNHISKRTKRDPSALPEPSTTPQGDPVARRQLLQAMAQLPDGYREVLVLHDVQGLRHREIAEILQIQPGTSKSQLSKARSQMRKLLTPKTPQPTQHEARS